MVKEHFQQPFLQSSVSHDLSEIILIFWCVAQETFLIIIDIEKLFNLFLIFTDSLLTPNIV